jgi:hypothetical protein
VTMVKFLGVLALCVKLMMSYQYQSRGKFSRYCEI